MTAPDPLRQGVLLALTAEQLGLLDAFGLTQVLAYYERQGARGSLSPDDVLVQLGGLDPASLPQLRATPPPAISLGARPFAERLQLLGSLGEGGMGAVYRAYDKLLRRVVALKLIRPQRLGLNAQRVLRRFEREAQVMARVRHPNCVAIYSAGELRGQPFLLMEYVRGESLQERVEREGPLEPQQVASWGRDLARGLASCHGAGVVHRDVKPANVLLDSTGCPRLTDFGIARDTAAQTQLTAESAAIGTLAYMPPEQALGQPADPRADVYGLGATLFEALTGALVHTAEQPLLLLHQITSDPARSVRSLRPELPLDLARVVAKCLEKDPADRYPSAEALAVDLEAFLAGRPVQARPLGALARLGRRLRRRRRPLLLGAAALALAVGVAWAVQLQRAAGLLAEEREALAAAEALPDPSAAVAALTSLAVSASPEVALAAHAALDDARLRQALAEAAAGVAALKSSGEALEELDRVQRELEGQGVPNLSLQEVPKQRYLSLQGERKRLEAIRAEQSLRARVALQRAEEVAPQSPAVGRAWAQFLTVQATATLEFETARGLRAEALQRLAAVGVEPLPDLGPPRVRLELDPRPGATVELIGLRLDPEAGRYVQEELGPWAPDGDGDLEAGRYLALVRWADASRHSVPVPFLAKLGPLQEIAVRRPALLGRDWAWGEFAWVLPGPTWSVNGRQSQRLEVKTLVPGFYAARTETPLEAWYAYRCARGWPAAAELSLGGKGFAERAPLPRSKARLPVGFVTSEEVDGFLGWFATEVRRARLPLAVGLPNVGYYARAVRGPFRWSYPWGDLFDDSFVTHGGLASVGSGRYDCSVFGIRDLVASCYELGRIGQRSAIPRDVVFGATALDSWSTTRAGVLNAGTLQFQDASRYLSFRVYAEEHPLPDITRDPEACAKHRQEALRLAGLTDYLGTIREATAAIDADPLDLEAWLIRATARLRLADNWGANFDAHRAVELKPHSGEAWSLLAMAQYERGFHAESLEAWDRALEIYPTFADSYRMRAHVKAALDDAAGARADLDTFEELAPPQHPMRRDAAALRAKLGE